jgi:amino acid transporter
MAQIGLRRDAIGLREVLFQSITDMAPGAAIAASIPFGVVYAGGALPLAVLVALIASLLTAWAIGQLAGQIPAAGSLATYAARGIHPSVGFLVAWAYVLVGWLTPPLVLTQLGFTTAATLHFEISGYPANLWWPWSLAGMLLIFVVGYFGIRTSARFGTILGIFEIAVFLVLAVLLLFHPGTHNTASVLGTTYATVKGYHGWSGIIAGSVFTVLAFLGFESAAPLAEEARNPRRTVQRAIVLSTLFIGLLYLFTTYAADVAFGPAKFGSFTTGTGQASWIGLGRIFHLFWILVFFAIINSTLANSNAGVNVSSRTAFAMGRIRLFPPQLAHVSSKHQSPVRAVATGVVIGTAIMLGLGFGYDPLTAFGMIATGLVILLVGIYIVMNAACIGYFGFRDRSKFNVLSHLIVPILAIVAFVPAWLTGAGIKAPGLSFITPLAKPLSYMGIAAGLWIGLGLIYMLILYVVRRSEVEQVAMVHLDAEPATTPAGAS